MTKFGELINSKKPILLDFYKENGNYIENQEDILRDVAAALGDRAKVVKIDIEKNQVLTDALRIKGYPTYIIYVKGEMKWRQSGEQNANTLISLVKIYS
ncbi:thioredoxin family protein [Aureivirga sp. CE67]|uniref:thioredoxin family protein n=1 Tax=Aureivirga sp. CE67 TaxID=1788983 RepID=UPI0018CA4AC5|nr:thioredoxin family protein [Aureivirga sp. CE67]